MVKVASSPHLFFRNTKFKLALWNGLFFFALITGLVFYLYFYTQRSLREEAKLFLRHEVTEMISIYKQKGTIAALDEEFAEEIEGNPGYRFGYGVLSRQGQNLSMPGDVPLPVDFQSILDLLEGNESSIVFTELTTPDEQKRFDVALTWLKGREPAEPYILVLGSDIDLIHEQMNRYQRVMFFVLPGFFLISLAMGWLLAGIALTPVRHMSKTMTTITARRLNERIPVKGSGDDLDRLAMTFNQLMDRMTIAYEKIIQFTGDVSHELKTPITVMKNEIEVTLSKNRSVEEYQTLLGSQVEELDRLVELVDGMLLLAKTDAGLIRLDQKKVNLQSLVSAVVEFMEPLAQSKEIQIHVGSKKDISVRADGSLLRRVLLNLVDNAIKYGQPNGEVRLEVYQKNDRAVLVVSDTGVGIPEAKLSKIFDRFYQHSSEDAATRDGYGLGLAISQSIVRAHRGKISVTSTPERGTTFTVSLPLS